MSRYGCGLKPIFGDYPTASRLFTESYSRCNRPGATPDRIARAITLVRTATTHTSASRLFLRASPGALGNIGTGTRKPLHVLLKEIRTTHGSRKTSKSRRATGDRLFSTVATCGGVSLISEQATRLPMHHDTINFNAMRNSYGRKNNNGHASQHVCLSHITAAGHCYKPGARIAAHRHLRRVAASRCPAATGDIPGTTRRCITRQHAQAVQN